MGIASATLQHSDPTVIEAHYKKGATIGSARAYEDMLGGFVNDIGLILPQ